MMAKMIMKMNEWTDDVNGRGKRSGEGDRVAIKPPYKMRKKGRRCVVVVVVVRRAGREMENNMETSRTKGPPPNFPREELFLFF
uniref:Uncharacterized protein n=1 Tax=Globodera rostochiensis TaxID=31243 RepID=A0A914HGE4_GLORO